MPKVHKTVDVDVDAKKAINYIADVRNHPAFIPPLKSIESVEEDPRLHETDWDWTFVMAGVELHGKSQTSKYEEGKAFSYKTWGEIESQFTYKIEDNNGQQELSIEVEYEVPEGVIAKAANKTLVQNINEKSAQQAVENLKVILESADN